MGFLHLTYCHENRALYEPLLTPNGPLLILYLIESTVNLPGAGNPLLPRTTLALLLRGIENPNSLSIKWGSSVLHSGYKAPCGIRRRLDFSGYHTFA